ncbi:DUF3618 domain-containing protein [Luteimonas deserti]|uniref:DUF3618 domain-containing protein n=1 Tax=Luteimonas deserti TaxID=2752306 RepID=A0A7Z0QNL6_9GAMM|nr:DUF3618 domain-containing protein [Luteimonas deserti]NYZ61931.1 DUF3618 domain-containing protein [Luteimonas deserti]
MNSPHPMHATPPSTTSEASPAQLEREVDRQREHIGSLVDALESKLSPGEIFERVLSYGKGGGREFMGNLGSTVRANPVPALLTAAGLVWLYASKDAPRTNPPGGHRDGNGQAGDAAGAGNGQATGDGDHAGLGDRVRDVAERLGGTMGDARDHAGEAVHGAVDATRDRARQASAGLQHLLEDNPLAAGAIGIAVGALLGAMLPSTRKEDEMLGETSDRLTGQAKAMAAKGYERASEAVETLATSQDGGQSGRQDAGHEEPPTPSTHAG